MSLIHVLGNFAFILVACSFMVKDILWLRLLSISASFCSITYNSYVTDRPLWVPICWNLFFMSLNFYHISKIMYGRRAIKLNDKEQELYAMSFKDLNLMEFAKLIRLGNWKKVEEDTVLIKENQDMQELMMIYNGQVEILVDQDKRKINELKDGQFIGEMSFLTSHRASASVVAKRPTELIVWRQSDLKELMKRNPSLLYSIQGAMGSQMAQALKNKNDS